MKLFIVLIIFVFLAYFLIQGRRSKKNITPGVANNRRKKTLSTYQYESDYSSETELVRKAINETKNIEFMYCKPSEKTYKKRVVRPSQILEINHEYDLGSTLCVRGYCYLRKDERTFAFKRMQELKIQMGGRE
jgi:predicted DNA-binding transcriptional regulator YafY